MDMDILSFSSLETAPISNPSIITKPSVPQNDIKQSNYNSLNLNTIESQENIDNQLDLAVENANKILKNNSRKLSYEIHEKTKKVIVSVIDTNTNEIIREISPENVLDAYAKMLELAGLLVDKKG